MIKVLAKGAFCALLILMSRSVLFAQTGRHGDVWVNGDNLIFSTEFSGTLPSCDTLALTQLYFHGGNSNICDSAGELLIACDGYNLYDRNFKLIDGGDMLVPGELYKSQYGWSGFAQTSIILPVANSRFYVVTPAVSDSEFLVSWTNPLNERVFFDQLLYHEVDMRANNGAGAVLRKKIPLLQKASFSKTQMMACRHADGKAWWLLKQACDTNLVYKFLFTDDRVLGPYVQGFAEPHFTSFDLDGQSMFSADGTRYATTARGAGKIFLADFDRCSGGLTNPRVIDVPPVRGFDPSDPNSIDSGTCGLSFSPDGQFLYVNGLFVIQQYDLQENDPSRAWTLLSGPDTTMIEFQQYATIYPGPDGRLYVGNIGGLGGQMSVIEYPDRKGTAAGFCKKCLRFPGMFFGGQTRHFAVSNPPCMPNYNLGSTAVNCAPLRTEERSATGCLNIYPNPATRAVIVTSQSSGLLEIVDVMGRVCMRMEAVASLKQTIDLDDVPPGMYVFKLSLKDGRSEARVVVKQ